MFESKFSLETSGSVTAAKAVKDDTEYSKVTDTIRTDLEAKLTAAAGFLTEDSKLANLDADGTLATTQASLESAKTALDTAVSALMPELTFVKTKASAAAKVTELESLVNSALKAELERQVNELTKEQADQATTMLVNLTSLKESLESLQTLVSDGLKMQVDYPQKYYDADNKEAFDAALLKASSVFPAFKWTNESIVVPAPEEGALPNPRAWTKAREKSEFVLQNFVIAPAQAAATTAPTESGSRDGSGGGTSAAASATVRVANGQAASADGAASREAQTTPDLASTVSYLKSLNDSLKAETDKLNGDNPTTKTAYYKADTGRTLYWDGFMPKIVVEGYEADGEGNGKATHEDANKALLQQWFDTPANWEKLSEQLTKKLGSDKFKNVTLANPVISYNDVSTGSEVRIPKVTFTVAAKDGYNLTEPTGNTKQISLSIRVLYTSATSTQNALRYQGVAFSGAPGNPSNPNDANVMRNVNVYLNYTGPAIVLNSDLPEVGSANNTTINGTSPIRNEDISTKLKALLNKTTNTNDPTELMLAITKYIQTFDPKYLSTRTDNGYRAWVSWMWTNRSALSQRELKQPADIFLQQMKDDTEAVYLPIGGTTDDKWLNTFLIRIPLTKFVKAIL
ncbi:hypothetical protein K6987_02680 [Mycoplasmopsis synoviae]|nr:hypothetical protein K6987_02680 [Mycoplasmopsis synoviae]